MGINKTVSRRSFLAGVGTAAMLASATPAFSQAAADWQAGAPAEWTRVLAAARTEGQVTVAAFPALAEKMSAGFKRDTGITLNFLGGGTAEQSARLEGEARARNVTIDILIGGGRELAPMLKEGFLEPVAPRLLLPGVVDVKNFHNGRHKWMDNSQQYLLQSAEFVNGWLVVNKDLVKPEEITWKSLLDPKYRGKITSYDLRGPGSGQGASAWLYKEFGIEYIKSLFIDQQVKFTTDNRGLVEGVVRGTTPIAFGGIQNEVERFRPNFPNLAVVLPSDAPGYLTGGFSVLKQAKGVPHPNAATVFINWFMSKPGQEIYESVMLETSRRLDVKTNVPDYLIPRPGHKYYDVSNEEEYFARSNVVKLITTTLGGR